MLTPRGAVVVVAVTAVEAAVLAVLVDVEVRLLLEAEGEPAEKSGGDTDQPARRLC